MRQRAWLDAVPERPKGDKSQAPQTSRLEKLRRERGDDSWMPEMPPVEGAGYLIGYLLEIGPVMAAGMGAGPITNLELRAWQENTGIGLQPWESRFLRRLSLEYLAEWHHA